MFFWQVDNLKAKLLEKLEHSLTDIQLIPEEIKNASPSAHEVSSLRIVSFCLLSFSQKHIYVLLFAIICSSATLCDWL